MKPCLLSLLLICTLCLRTLAVNLTVDAAQTFQTMDGFGVNVNSLSWDDGELRPALDKLVDDLSATMYRVILDEMDWEAVNDNADPNSFNWTYYNAIYGGPKFQELWSTLRYLNSKGIESGLMLNFMGKGPDWIGPASTVSVSMEDEFVETIASAVYYARNSAGVRFTLLAPMNEPDWDGIEGPLVDPVQYTRILAKLAARLEDIGLGDIRFVGPDGARTIADLQNFGGAMLGNSSVMAKMAKWAIHSYGPSVSGASAFIAGTPFPNLRFWVTETARFEDALAQLGDGPSATLVWDGFDAVCNHAIRAGRGTVPHNDLGNGPTLLAYDTGTRLFTPRREFYEYAQLFKFVAPGAVRIGGTDNDGNLTVSAFRHPATGRVTIIGRNSGSGTITVNGTLTNLPAAVSTFESYRTNLSSNLQRGADVPVSGNAFSLTVAGHTVFTLATPVPKLDTHEVVVDGTGKLLSWFTPQDRAYAHVAKLSADFIKAAMVGPIDGANGLPMIYTHSEYHPTTFIGSGWPNHPAGRNSMLADSLILYYAYSGDSGVLDAVRGLLDYQLSSAGTTPANYYWAKVPWSASAASNPQYGTDSISEGVGNIEPDKFGELGFFGYLRFYQVTGETKYRDAAVACADALAAHVRPGNTTHSPWPFRANAQTGAIVEEYCAHVIAPIRLFDELIRLNLGNVAAYQAARTTSWNWLMTCPMTNNFWTKYFEDVGIDGSHSGNLNQYNPGQTVRYFLERPDLNPNWQAHSTALIAWIESNFGGTDNGEPGLQYGARVISEQNAYKYKMASHTSRFAAICAMLAEKTGDPTLREKAFRSLNWCSYMARSSGSVIEGPFKFIQNQNNWYSDGHGDYIRNFMLAMGAQPEWAPANENRLLRSSSVVKSVAYNPGSISYTTYDAASTEVFRLSSTPLSVTANGTPLSQRVDLTQEGWTYSPATGVLRVRHDAAMTLVVIHTSVNVRPTCTLTSPAAEATVAPPASILLVASATDSDGTVAKVEFFSGATKLGEDTTAPYHFAWSNAPFGSYTLTAVATDNQDAQITSTSVALTVGAASNVALGSTSEGTTTDTLTDNTGAYINACRFQATQTMTIDKLRAKVGAIVGSYQCAIYEDFNGSARNLLRDGGTITNPAEGWHDFPLTSPLNVANGSFYWLAVWSDDVNARISALSSGAIRYAAYPFSTWPSPVNLTGSGTFTYSIFATGPAGTNVAPTCNAGSTQTITLPATATLNGTASDDAQPSALTTEWVVESGPGAVTFGNANEVITTASFTQPGSYTLRLLATDGAVTTASDVVITARDSFAAWAARNDVPASALDTDGDGLGGLFEYGFATDPTSHTPAPWSAQLSGNRLRLTFPRNPALTDVTYTVQASDDFTAWTPIARSSSGATTLSLGAFQVQEGASGSLLSVSVTDSAPVAPETRRFLRLEVTSP